MWFAKTFPGLDIHNLFNLQLEHRSRTPNGWNCNARKGARFTPNPRLTQSWQDEAVDRIVRRLPQIVLVLDSPGGRSGVADVGNGLSRNSALEYSRRYVRLRERACKEGILTDNHEYFVQWLIARRPTMAASYWRKAKAVALFGLLGEGDIQARRATAMLRLETSVGARPEVRRSGRVSACEGQLADLLVELQKRIRSHRAFTVAKWITSGLTTGVRPSEWPNTHLQDADQHGGPYLLISGIPRRKRILDLSSLLPDEIDAVHFMVRLGKGGDFERDRKGCMEFLSRIGQKLWPSEPRVSLHAACRRYSEERSMARGRPAARLILNGASLICDTEGLPMQTG